MVAADVESRSPIGFCFRRHAFAGDRDAWSTGPAPGRNGSRAAAGDRARIQAEAQKEIERRLPAAVNAALEQRFQNEVRPALVQMERQVAEREKLDVANYEQQSDKKRQADLQAVRYALETYERRLNFAMLSARRGGGD
ncbi:MAG: hypothetical protein ABSC08_07100 [Bryobacteraceae bacterium]